MVAVIQTTLPLDLTPCMCLMLGVYFRTLRAFMILKKEKVDAGDLEERDVKEAVDHANADDQLPLG